ncbi:5-oxoprolinase/urea amidolyase family protein [Serratia marcescens]|nr:5-oxoprolinase/urea amidolyase family protein [Serratia marcescens]MBH2865966.1 5-oxoprolinase/urea amidolyase family protein [Serratia marcescens]
MYFLPVSDDALLVEMGSQEEVISLYSTLKVSPMMAVCEFIPAARTLLIRFKKHSTDMQKLIHYITSCRLSEFTNNSNRQINVPVNYNGEDLYEVAEILGVNPDEVIRRHTECEYVVAFTGFVPGFAYLFGNNQLLVPRRNSPRPRIQAGAVGLAGEYCGIYPRSSPGGWQIIGTTSLAMWEIEREVPATLSPGMRVNFYREDHRRSYSLSTHSTSIPPPPLQGKPVLKISFSGIQMLFQDDGRPGYSALGVSASGAADHGAFHSANRIVGNSPDEACLEFIPGGVLLQALRDCTAAITGADCTVTLTTTEGDSHVLSLWQPLDIRAGDKLTFGPAKRGCRCYLALRNGFVVSPVLQSSSSDMLGGIGPAAVQNGDVILMKTSSKSTSVSINETPAYVLPAVGDTVILDIIPGPRVDWFTDESVSRFFQLSWLVTPLSDRTGLRLRADAPLIRSEVRELFSEGLLPGAIQVPHDGNPVLFLADTPVTGGYPVIGYVATHHLDLAGQLAPGVSIHFNLLTSCMPLKEAEGKE